MSKTHEIRDVGLSGIAVLPTRMRMLRPEVVDELIQSMSGPGGLLQPIIVRPAEATGYYLIAGRHRLEAARKLKWESIACSILDGLEADAALLAEIDENLVRADLTPAERAAHQAARKEVYERQHPETRKGATGGTNKGKHRTEVAKLATSVDRYTADAAKKTGKSERSVQREAARGAAILDIAELAGTSLDKGDELDAMAKLSAGEQADLAGRAKAGEKVSAKTRLKQARRQERERQLAERIQDFPDNRYGVIVADPEWQFELWSRETGMDRAADNHYPTSCLEIIKSREVPSIAALDCILWLWATIPMLPHALIVMSAWGFDYKSHYVWGKDKFGTGFWNREKHELLLIGTRGNVPCPAPGTQWDSLIMAPRGEHSEKPECFLEMIEQYFPNVPKIELNRRGPPRPGWDAWGNEAEMPEAAE